MVRPPLMTTVAILLLVSASVAESQRPSMAASDITGLWEAKRRLGPDVRGRLYITAVGPADQPGSAAWRATIAGRMADVRLNGDTMWFALPDRSGSFIGAIDARSERLVATGCSHAPGSKVARSQTHRTHSPVNPCIVGVDTEA